MERTLNIDSLSIGLDLASFSLVSEYVVCGMRDYCVTELVTVRDTAGILIEFSFCFFVAVTCLSILLGN